ncbi:MAG: hypothetical protein B7Z58_06505 [Acidiphilium sp. 37-64-53]|uniref:tyrosine-type recombinase/integrase n=1 Tax=Acidiphilium TaxID=522 RepID=UPI000BDB6731|nr:MULTISPECIES: site-specific integrase [Acidiphilium]OYW02659.1 MAG: hypothetical protein B7Z58_06505 [Acidiphilium sp. 37-64-53]OZB29946.1 MAG: hypothetical protein B7X49_04750 [Acidiphilium sp. 34-64-41]HQT85144.1 site-specific integrase [Acidiphilium rubrum]
MAIRKKLPKGIDIKDGSYRARIYRDGRKAMRMFETLVEAKVWLEAQRIALDADDYGERLQEKAKAKAMSLSELLDSYLEKVVPIKAESGQKASRDRIRMWQRQQWASLPVASIRPHHILDWMDTESNRTTRLGGKPKATTISNPVNLLSAVFEYGRSKLQLKIDNPVKGIARPAAEYARISVPDINLEGLILEYAAASRARWMKTFVILAAWTAMRQGEIRKLRWEWINLEAGYILLPPTAKVEPDEPAIRITKNGKQRGIPLLPIVRSALREWQGNHDGKSGWAFPSFGDAAEPIPANTVSTRWQRLYSDIKQDHPDLRHQTFHDFRHWGCTRLAKYHVNILDLANTTGHQTVQILARYYDPDPVEKTNLVMTRYDEIHGSAETTKSMT